MFLRSSLFTAAIFGIIHDALFWRRDVFFAEFPYEKTADYEKRAASSVVGTNPL